MSITFVPSYTPTIHPKDDFWYYKKLEEKIWKKFNLTDEQFESLFFENGKMWETKQWPFTLCHRDSMINTIKEMDFFPTLMKLNIKETIPWKERKIRFPMNATWQRYKINKDDILKLKQMENEEAERNQKWRKESEWPIWFKLLLIVYLKHEWIINENFEIINNFTINNGRYSLDDTKEMFWEKYTNSQTNSDTSTLYNENILIDINRNNTLQTIKIWPFKVFPIDFKIKWLDNIEDSPNIIIEKDGIYYLPKDWISWNIKTCIFDAHAYAFKWIYKNNEGKEIIILENPRNTAEEIHIRLNDIADFCIFTKIQIDITKLLEDILSENPLHNVLQETRENIASIASKKH